MWVKIWIASNSGIKILFQEVIFEQRLQEKKRLRVVLWEIVFQAEGKRTKFRGNCVHVMFPDGAKSVSHRGMWNRRDRQEVMVNPIRKKVDNGVVGVRWSSDMRAWCGNKGITERSLWWWSYSESWWWCRQQYCIELHTAVATGLGKVSFHSNPKERQSQRLLKLRHNCAHLTH